MEENIHKDNLEEFFKNAINKAGDEPAEDAWDMPSDDVWEGVKASINPPSNPKAFFNWKWLGAILLSVVLLGALYYNYSLNQKIDNLTEAIKENKTQIEDLKTTNDTKNKSQISNSSQVDSQKEEDQEPDIPGDQSDSKPIDQNKSFDKTPDQLSVISNAASGNNIEDQNKTDREKSKNSKENQIKSEDSNILAKAKNQATDQQPVSDLSNPETRIQNNKQPVKATNQSSTDEKAPTAISHEKKEIADDDLKTESHPETKPNSVGNIPDGDKDPVLAKLETPEKADSIDQSMESKAFANSITDTTAISENPGENKKANVEQTELTQANNAVDETIDSTTISETMQIPGEQAPVENKNPKGFYIGAHIAPTYAYREIQLTNNNPLLRKLLNEQEKADYSYSFGIKAGYQFSKNWSVETGANYSKATIMSRHRKQIQHRQENEMQGAQGFDSNHRLTLNTSYGEVDTDVAVTRASDTSIPQNDFIGLRINTRQDLSFVRIPVVVKYKTAGGKKLHVSAKTGIMNSFIVNRDVQINAVIVQRQGITFRRTAVQRKFTGLKKSSIDMLFGIGLEYDITSKLGIYFEPTITRSIRPVYEHGPIKTYPVITTIDVGLSYRF